MSNQAERADKRLFPRLPVRCPVLYQVQGSPRRMTGLVVDFSATGLKMLCRDAIDPDSTLQLELKPGANRAIPALRADGRVVRCEPYARGGFWVSCHLRRVHPAAR